MATNLPEDSLRSRKSWLARVLVRLWGSDPDLESERAGGADELQRRLSTLPLKVSGPTPDVDNWRGTVVSVNLDRSVRTAVNYSTKTVKADAVRRVFEIDCSGLTWAVIDAGIDARHPAFRLTEEPFDTRVTRVLDFTRITKRAYRDLRNILDFVGAVDNLAAVPPPRRADDQEFPPGAGSHGTHVAGVLAGNWLPLGEGEVPLVGMCPDLRLWDLRVVSADAENLESRVVMALQYVREVNERAGKELRVAGVNISLSIPYNPESFSCGWTPVCQEARRLVRSGVIVVVSAGNEGFDASIAGPATAGRGFATVGITDPGNADEVITVGATHRFEPHRYGASYFSSKGPTADGRLKPDLLAPGENIRSAIDRQGAGSMNGTSQAAPHVSGAAALLLARYRELLGRPEEVKRILCSTATDLGRAPNFQGAGLLDVMRALQAV
jgi:subtilisin family serine protease